MDFLKIKKKIIGELDSILSKAEKAEALAKAIVSSEKIFVVGSGRSGLMIEAFAKRLGHLGLDIHVAGEAVQPRASKKDMLIIASGSGKSIFPLSMAKKAKEIGMRVALITARRESEISKISDLTVYIPASIKMDSPAAKKSFQPLSNLFEQSLLIFCDIVAILIQKKKGLQDKDLLKRHTNLE